MAAPLALIAAPLFEFGGKLLDRWFPDPTERAKAEREFVLAMSDREFKEIAGQLEVNAREALHPSIFVAGWRPWFGWLAGFGFGYSVLFRPLLAWISLNMGWLEPPEVNVEILTVVAAGMLGVGGLRTYEKKAGVTK